MGTPTTPFDFTEDNYTIVNRILSKDPANYRQSGIIPLLDLAQRQNGGWRPVADREKVGKYFIQLCGTTPCMICGAGDIKKTIESHLGITDGGTSEDGLFTLLEVECLGACANAPMIQLNDDYYECLTNQTMVELLDACTNDERPSMGKWGSLPMNGQVSCEGPLGKTSLGTVPEAPVVELERFSKAGVDPASVKAHMGY